MIAVSLPLILGSMGGRAEGKASLCSTQVLRVTGIVAASFASAVVLPGALAAAMVFLTGQTSTESCDSWWMLWGLPQKALTK